MRKILKNYLRHKHHLSLRHALDGIKYTIDTQQNFFLHIVIFLLVLIGSFIYRISKVEFLIVLLTSSLVFSLEIINTSIEALADEVAKGKYKDLIKVVKDAASGAVLLSVVFAIIIALIIFLPKVLDLLAEI